MPKSKQSSIILFCQGGAGDVLAHTPMIRYFRNKYPDDKIVVTSTYSQLFDNNPNIDLVVPLKDPKDFYTEHVLNKNVRFFKKHFVYDAIMDEPAMGCKNLPEFICKVYGAEYDGKPLDYIISDYERRAAKTFVDQYRPFNKPIVLLHCTGSIPSDGAFNKTNSLKDLKIDTVNKLVDRLKDKVIFIHVGLEGEPKVTGAIDALGTPMRDAIALIGLVDTYILIESLFAHCSNALGTSGLVVFQNTSPNFFGYSNNYNLSFNGGCEVWPCNRPVGALLDLAPGYRNPKTRQPLLWECPNQVCANIPVEELEKSLLTALEDLQKKKVQKGNPALEAARRTPPPSAQKFSLVDAPTQGKVIAGDVNTVLEPAVQMATLFSNVNDEIAEIGTTPLSRVNDQQEMP